MYRCSRCQGLMDYPHDHCPHCGVLLSGVKCMACSYTAAKTVFIRNNHRCPKCGSHVPTEISTNEQSKINLAAFFRRLAAQGIDNTIIILFFVMFAIIFSKNGRIVESDLFVIAMLSSGWLYGTLMESSHLQATIGKRIVRIKVESCDGERIKFGKAMGRNALKLISLYLLGLGHIMIIFNEKEQGLHDKLAKTIVTKIARV